MAPAVLKTQRNVIEPTATETALAAPIDNPDGCHGSSSNNENENFHPNNGGCSPSSIRRAKKSKSASTSQSQHGLLVPLPSSSPPRQLRPRLLPSSPPRQLWNQPFNSSLAMHRLPPIVCPTLRPVSIHPSPRPHQSLPATTSLQLPTSTSLLPPAPRPIPQPMPPPVLECQGVHVGNFGKTLIFAAQTLRNTANKFTEWARKPDFGLSEFISSILSTTRDICLPFNGMIMGRASNPQDGFTFRAESCNGDCQGSANQRCSVCVAQRRKKAKHIKNVQISANSERPGLRATIAKISANPDLSATEIREARITIKKLERELAATRVLQDELATSGQTVPNDAAGKRIRDAVNIMDGTISRALESSGATVEAEIWRIHTQHINKVYEQGGKGRGFKRLTYHPALIDWSMAFLARTSAGVYSEVAKVMMLPDISHVYRLIAKKVSTESDKAYCLHMNTIRSLSERASKENWTSNQRVGCIAQDSANIKAGIEHDYVSNTLKGGDETHSIVTLSRLFEAMAQKVKDSCDESTSEEAAPDATVLSQNSILDNIPLAEEHLVFKWTSVDPAIKCSMIVASVNVNKVTPAIITTIMITLRDTLPMFGLTVGMATSDAAGSNWASFRDTLSTHTIRDALPRELLEKYPTVDFDVKCLMKDPVTKQWIVFIPDMPHLTKNIVTCLERSSSVQSKRNLKYGKVPLNMWMIHEIWMKCGGASGQLHSTKLTADHFHKNAFSRMNVKLATQLLSASTVDMIRAAILDDDIVLSLNNKGMYNHLADLCEFWNTVVDICNGREGCNRNSPHTPANAAQRQTILLDTLKWFSRWKELHDERVNGDEASEYNYFANETWFCTKSLLLSHVVAIQLYCIEKGKSINPRTLNTDTVEWHFADARQMVGGSTNKLTARKMDQADKQASTFNNAKFSLVGNNCTGDNHFGRAKRY